MCAGIVDKKGLTNARVLVFFTEKYNENTLYDLQYDATTKTVKRVPIKNTKATVILQQKDLQIC